RSLRGRLLLYLGGGRARRLRRSHRRRGRLGGRTPERRRGGHKVDDIDLRLVDSRAEEGGERQGGTEARHVREERHGDEPVGWRVFGEGDEAARAPVHSRRGHHSSRLGSGSVTIPTRSTPARRTRSMVSTTAP